MTCDHGAGRQVDRWQESVTGKHTMVDLSRLSSSEQSQIDLPHKDSIPARIFESTDRESFSSTPDFLQHDMRSNDVL